MKHLGCRCSQAINHSTATVHCTEPNNQCVLWLCNQKPNSADHMV